MDAEILRAKTPENLEDYPGSDVYREWQEREGVPVIVDYAFEDLRTLELGVWERKGGKGAIINIPNNYLPNDCQVVEIKPGGTSQPEHHLYEEMVYILSGRGATSVWLDEDRKQTFEWNAGSLFSIPLNAWYQHYNASGTEPVRYAAVTNAPPVMRQWRNIDFIFTDTFRFTERYGGEEDFFSSSGKAYTKRRWQSNFVPSAPTMPLFDYLTRGAGGIQAHIMMAKNVTGAHISEFPVGTYKKAHRHGPGAHLLILSGVGYSLLWNKEDRSDMRRANWRVGSMVIVPADATFHQHFNTGPERARYLALRQGYGTPSGFVGSDVSINEGGWQIEYEDEAGEIHEMFEADLQDREVPCSMKAFIASCTGVVGPTSERDT